jgi:N-acetylneuraminate synthase/sialic acid synthase
VRPTIDVGGRQIGDGQPVFVVAEIGLNHNGDTKLAEQLVRAAVTAGADAVKFQKRNPRALLTRAQYDSPYTGGNSFGATYGEHREALELSVAELRHLADVAHDLGVTFFASPWDLPSVSACEELAVPLYKIASADVTNVPLIEAVANTRKPVFMSTGMSTEEEVATAVDTIRAHHEQLVLLSCVSTYPAEFEEVNLAVMRWLRDRFDCLVGYSGHERGIAVSAVAVGLGACVIERHFTLDRTMKGPDHAASLEPPGLTRLVRDIRAVETALGSPGLRVAERERTVRAKLAKSVVAARSLPAGRVLSSGDLIAKSPGDGMSPAQIPALMGRTLACAVEEDEKLLATHLVPR